MQGCRLSAVGRLAKRAVFSVQCLVAVSTPLSLRDISPHQGATRRGQIEHHIYIHRKQSASGQNGDPEKYCKANFLGRGEINEATLKDLLANSFCCVVCFDEGAGVPPAIFAKQNIVCTQCNFICALRKFHSAVIDRCPSTISHFSLLIPNLLAHRVGGRQLWSAGSERCLMRRTVLLCANQNHRDTLIVKFFI